MCLSGHFFLWCNVSECTFVCSCPARHVQRALIQWHIVFVLSHSTGCTLFVRMAGIVSVMFAGARYHRNMPGQMPQQDMEYNKMWAEQQRRVQLAAMEQPAYAPGMHPMAYPLPTMVPINAPMQHFSG